MKQISYSETETVYAAGRTMEEARRALENCSADNPQAAWDALGYWEREEEADKFEVFKFVTTVQVTKVDPPYSKQESK